MLCNAHVYILLQSGGGTWSQVCTLLEVWVLRVGMSTLGRKRLCTRGSGTLSSSDDPGAFPGVANPHRA
jgi:hypothetical protein